MITTEVFAYEARTLLRTLDELAEEGDDSSIRDFGHELLPRLVDEGTARAFELDGYWRDVGTVDSYWEAHMELLADEPPLTLDDPAWPILTTGLQRPPARIEESATCRRLPRRWGGARPRNRRAVGHRPRRRRRGGGRGSGRHPPPRQLCRRSRARNTRDRGRGGQRRRGHGRWRHRRNYGGSGATGTVTSADPKGYAAPFPSGWRARPVRPFLELRLDDRPFRSQHCNASVARLRSCGLFARMRGRRKKVLKLVPQLRRSSPNAASCMQRPADAFFATALAATSSTRLYGSGPTSATRYRAPISEAKRLLAGASGTNFVFPALPGYSEGIRMSARAGGGARTMRRLRRTQA